MFEDFADFTGCLLQDYHHASNHVTTKITKLEQERQHDRDTIVSTKTTMDKLRELVAETTKANANAKAISDLLTAINTVRLDTTTAVNDPCVDTNKIITQFSQTIGSVRTTAEEAKGLANNARILAGNVQEKVTLFSNEVDRHATQLGKLHKFRASVAKLGQEVVQLQAAIQRQPPAMDAGVWDMASMGAQSVNDSPLERNTGVWDTESTGTP